MDNKRSYIILSLLCLITVNSCATGTQPKDASVFYEDPEAPKGPGLFSGEKGEFVLFSQEKTKHKEENTEKCECESK